MPSSIPLNSHLNQIALAYKALAEAGIAVAPVDHLISWAMYFDDPDGNGLEIYVDTRREAHGRELWHGENPALEVKTVLSVLLEGYIED